MTPAPQTVESPSSSDSYIPSAKSRVKRNHMRGVYDKEAVHALFDASPMGQIGYVIDGAPYVTPTLIWREGSTLYWHGSSASRMLRSVKSNIPVCVTVAHFDGWVLARSGFHHSANYRSAMAFGSANLIEDPAEKERTLRVMMEQVFPGRWEQLRPITAQELKATMVVSMEIEEASAKVRTGGPVDDEEDYALDIWAGVLPLSTEIGALVPDPRNNIGVNPDPSLSVPLR